MRRALTVSSPFLTANRPSLHSTSNNHTNQLSPASEPKPDWAPFLEGVRRGQVTVGRDKAVPMLIGT